MNIITISREFGSGGREVGKRLADALGYDYYDTEIVETIAEKCELDPEYVDSILEKGVFTEISITFGHSFSYVPYQHHKGFSVIEKQSEIIKELAKKGNCVIVGRNADIILRKLKPLRIFVHASFDSRLKRCIERADESENLTERQLKRKIKAIDRARATTHSYYSEIRWGDKEGYDLCINTTNLQIKSVIPSLADYVKDWFER